MKGEWCHVTAYFSKEYCNNILDQAKNIPFQKATLGENAETIVDQFRKSDVKWLYPHEFKQLYDDVWKLQIEINREWFGFRVDNLEYIQLARYDGNIQGEYKRHKDVFWVNNKTRHRKLSAVIQLTDPNEYEGGDLSFFDCSEYPNPKEIRQQGTIIFFPSFIDHQANPVLKGVRHSLALWFEGPKWR